MTLVSVSEDVTDELGRRAGLGFLQQVTVNLTERVLRKKNIECRNERVEKRC